MKTSLGTGLLVVALSLAVWVTFYVVTPGAPLTLPETVAVVGTCGAAVLAAKWIWTHLRKIGGRHEGHP